jgi:hypothetical protein
MGQKIIKIMESPHPLAPSPKFGRRGTIAKSEVSYSLSQDWERAGVRALMCPEPRVAIDEYS